MFLSQREQRMSQKRSGMEDKEVCLRAGGSSLEQLLAAASHLLVHFPSLESQ